MGTRAERRSIAGRQTGQSTARSLASFVLAAATAGGDRVGTDAGGTRAGGVRRPGLLERRVLDHVPVQHQRSQLALFEAAGAVAERTHSARSAECGFAVGSTIDSVVLGGTAGKLDDLLLLEGAGEFMQGFVWETSVFAVSAVFESHDGNRNVHQYGWGEAGSDLTVLDNTATWVRHSRSAECQDGKYRMNSRAYAAGPNGEAAVWSLWAVGYASNIDC